MRTALFHGSRMNAELRAACLTCFDPSQAVKTLSMQSDGLLFSLQMQNLGELMVERISGRDMAETKDIELTRPPSTEVD